MTLQNPVFLFFIFLALLLGMAFIRWLEKRRIRARFEASCILSVNFGVEFYGKEQGALLRSKGAMVLLKDGLYYQARFSKETLFIPAGQLKKIATTDSFKGRPLYHPIIMVEFEETEGVAERAAFRIPEPHRWLEIIKTRMEVRGLICP